MKLNYLVILLNFNNWQDTLDCIDSLKKSDVEDQNILVVENCSSDESFERLSNEFPCVKILKMQKNLGFTGGNNIGIKYALENGFEYAIVLNNDTIIESKESLKILIQEMDNNPDVTLSTGRIFYYPKKDIIWYDGGKLIKSRAMAIHINYRKDKNQIKLNNENREIDFISGCYMCIRLKDIPKLGYMDEKIFIYLDDVEYSARAVRNNLKLRYIPQAVIYHKARGEDKLTPRMAYYSIRNRRLIINLHFGLVSKIYFEIVIIIKRIMWFFTNKKYYSLLMRALKDYKKGYFGQAPEL